MVGTSNQSVPEITIDITVESSDHHLVSVPSGYVKSLLLSNGPFSKVRLVFPFIRMVDLSFQFVVTVDQRLKYLLNPIKSHCSTFSMGKSTRNGHFCYSFSMFFLALFYSFLPWFLGLAIFNGKHVSSPRFVAA